MRALGGLIAAIALLLAAPGHAQERFTNAQGGSGGQQFMLRCPAGAYLTGVAALIGAYVDNIAPICDGRTMPGTGGRGNPRSASCPNGSVVKAADITSLRSDNALLKAMVLHCVARGTRTETAAVPLDTPGAYTYPVMRGIFWIPGYPHGTADCGAQDATGLQGRSGASVDSVGLICNAASAHH